MKTADKEQSLRVIKSMLKIRLKRKGIQGVNDAYLDKAALEIYEGDPEGIQQLESETQPQPPQERDAE